MEEKYKLQFFDRYTNDVLAIQWAGERKDYVPGDCYVRAILETTNVDEHNESQFQKQEYNSPMTLDEAKNFISDNRDMLGKVHDCVGLRLEDICKVVNFDEPIQVRNLQKS